ncbi:MAG: ABC transporter permease [Gemmatimonas sp.]|nr:ABC transporter permease [Gemmatimonas sp.]
MALLVVLLALAALRGPDLFTAGGMAGAISVATPLILATLALTPIAIAGRGGVDLAVGPVLVFVNVTVIHWLVANDITSPLAIIPFALAVGIVVQLIQGLAIAVLRLQPVVVTLSGFLVFAGLDLVILSKPGGEAPGWLASWGAGTDLLSPALLVLLGALVAWALIARSTLFRNIRLMGSNERTAYASGIQLIPTRLGAHAIAGVFVGLAGLMYTALIASGDPTQGDTYTLIAVTALVLGGTSLAGGLGGGLGSVMGAIDLFLISYVLSTFDFGSSTAFVVQLTYGLVLVCALAFGSLVTIVVARRRTWRAAGAQA